MAALWGVAAYAFHAVGNANGLYLKHWWFQIVAHYWSATAVAGLLAVAGLSLDLRGRRLAAFVVGLTAVGAFGWELVEFLGVFEHLNFHGFGDFLVDTASNTAGLATVLALLRRRRSTDGSAARSPFGRSGVGASASQGSAPTASAAASSDSDAAD
jgi:hypothetical protein